MTATAAPSYGGEKLTCPVCGDRLCNVDSYMLPVDFYACDNEHCRLWTLSGGAGHWRFLNAAIDPDCDEVREARKAVARRGNEQA